MAKEQYTLKRYMRAEDFFKDAKPNTTAEEVRKEMGKSLEGKCCCLDEHGKSINLK